MMQQQTSITKVPNNSGQKGLSAEDVPEEIRGNWNWGAFFLSFIWGIGNNVWISLLSLIPIVNIVMAFVLGANGNKWAWQKKSWDSIENFQKTQKTWAVWGIVIAVLSIFLRILSAAMGATK